MNGIKDKINTIVERVKEKIPSLKPVDDGNEEEILDKKGDTPEEHQDKLPDALESEMEEVSPSFNEKKRLAVKIVLGTLVAYLVYDQVSSTLNTPPLNPPSPPSPSKKPPKPSKPSLINKSPAMMAKDKKNPTQDSSPVTPPIEKSEKAIVGSVPAPKSKDKAVPGNHEQAVPGDHEQAVIGGPPPTSDTPDPNSGGEQAVIGDAPPISDTSDPNSGGEQTVIGGPPPTSGIPDPNSGGEQAVIGGPPPISDTSDPNSGGEQAVIGGPPPTFDTSDPNSVDEQAAIGGPPSTSDTSDPNSADEQAAIGGPPSIDNEEPNPTSREISSQEDKPVPPNKIRQKFQYSPSPDYSRSGRGLVYNCKGQHWACVDKVSYFQCRKNYFWSMQEKKSPDCAIKNVYANDNDCHIVHTHYLNNQQPTDFCKPMSLDSPEQQ